MKTFRTPPQSKPAHLFNSCDGSLCDTRNPDWAKKPLRPVFCQHFGTIENTAQLKATLRAGEFAWPGGYPLYFINSDGAVLSFDSVRAELRQILCSIREGIQDGWQVVACNVNYGDGDLYCDHSGERIPSAYAEPDEA